MAAQIVSGTPRDSVPKEETPNFDDCVMKALSSASNDEDEDDDCPHCLYSGNYHEHEFHDSIRRCLLCDLEGKVEGPNESTIDWLTAAEEYVEEREDDVFTWLRHFTYIPEVEVDTYADAATDTSDTDEQPGSGSNSSDETRSEPEEPATPENSEEYPSGPAQKHNDSVNAGFDGSCADSTNADVQEAGAQVIRDVSRLALSPSIEQDRQDVDVSHDLQVSSKLSHLQPGESIMTKSEIESCSSEADHPDLKTPSVGNASPPSPTPSTSHSSEATIETGGCLLPVSEPEPANVVLRGRSKNLAGRAFRKLSSALGKRSLKSQDTRSHKTVCTAAGRKAKHIPNVSAVGVKEDRARAARKELSKTTEATKRSINLGPELANTLSFQFLASTIPVQFHRSPPEGFILDPRSSGAAQEKTLKATQDLPIHYRVAPRDISDFHKIGSCGKNCCYPEQKKFNFYDLAKTFQYSSGTDVTLHIFVDLLGPAGLVLRPPHDEIEFWCKEFVSLNVIEEPKTWIHDFEETFQFQIDLSQYFRRSILVHSTTPITNAFVDYRIQPMIGALQKTDALRVQAGWEQFRNKLPAVSRFVGDLDYAFRVPLKNVITRPWETFFSRNRGSSPASKEAPLFFKDEIPLISISQAIPTSWHPNQQVAGKECEFGYLPDPARFHAPVQPWEGEFKRQMGYDIKGIRDHFSQPHTPGQVRRRIPYWMKAQEIVGAQIPNVACGSTIPEQLPEGYVINDIVGYCHRHFPWIFTAPSQDLPNFDGVLRSDTDEGEDNSNDVSFTVKGLEPCRLGPECAFLVWERKCRGCTGSLCMHCGRVSREDELHDCRCQAELRAEAPRIVEWVEKVEAFRVDWKWEGDDKVCNENIIEDVNQQDDEDEDEGDDEDIEERMLRIDYCQHSRPVQHLAVHFEGDIELRFFREAMMLSFRAREISCAIFQAGRAISTNLVIQFPFTIDLTGGGLSCIIHCSKPINEITHEYHMSGRREVCDESFTTECTKE